MRVFQPGTKGGCRTAVLLFALLIRVGLAIPAGADPLLTRWAAAVNATNSLPEYPRPQLVRPHWLNLNGLWEFQVTQGLNERPAQFEGKILVPFPVESYLSGVGHAVPESGTLWYRRTFTIPPAWKNKRVRINFGAVDWATRVFVNGRFIGEHQGGYDAFAFDLTKALNAEGTNELVVSVADPTEGDQPRGKQTRKAEGIFYSSSSGIWQTVWLEPLPHDYIQGLTLVPDFEEGSLKVTVLANSLAPDLRADVVVSFKGSEVGRAEGGPGAEFVVRLKERHPWSPADPALYDVSATLLKGRETQDRVTSYFGLREIALGADASGTKRLLLNREPLFQMGVLDQGFWPDGLYTAPTDEALRYDLETAKKLGFNTVRKHVKVEPERWYYWADKLGMLVWQDMPSGKNTTEAARRQFEAELERMLDQKANHPSIITWVLFNEGWGQFDTERLAGRIKAADPTRLVNNASGWTDMKMGDVIDVHSYPQPLAPPPEPARAGVLGEFGGLGLGITNHTWEGRQPWGYQVLPDAQKLTEGYVDLLHNVWGLQKSSGLAAAIYTQITDVETECNGFLTYDRELVKMDAASVYRANVNMPKLLPDARDGAFAWSYTFDPPATNWMALDFSDEKWKTGIGGFGAPNPPKAIINTEWKTPEIWLRREFEMPEGIKAPSRLVLYHDEDAEVYINGVLAVSVKGYTTGYVTYDIAGEARHAFHPGRNVIAVHCQQFSGGQYIDVGIWPELGLD